MPIILNNDSVAVLDVNGNATTATKPMQTFSPKFFNSKLTGKGGSSKGLLTEKIEADKTRVDIKTKNGDFLVEMDIVDRNEIDKSVTVKGDCAIH